MIRARWEGVAPPSESATSTSVTTIARTGSYLLDLDENLEIEPELVEAFHVLLQILICKNGRCYVQRHLGNTELLDRVLVLAQCFEMVEVAETIASALMEQEEERIANSQCLKCGEDCPDFCLVSRELCTRCCSQENLSRQQTLRDSEWSSGKLKLTNLQNALDQFLEAHKAEIAVHAVTPGLYYGHGLGEAISI